MNTEPKRIELLSFATGDVVVPQGAIAVYDAANGPCQIKGKLINHGTITFNSGQNDKLVVIADEILNTGKLETGAGSLSLCFKVLENSGEINGGDLIKLVGTTGRISATGAGNIKALKKLDVDGRMGVTINGGTYTAPSIEFNAEHGNVSVSADALDGEVTANAKAAKIGSKTGTLNIGQNRLLSGNHVYYNANGNVSLGSINHGTDNVAILATGDVSVSGNITAGDLFIGAGIGFTINGQYPSPIQDNNADVSWAATTIGYGTVDVGGTITTSQWLTVNAGYITLNDLTIGNSVLIETPGGNGEFTVEGDIDVEHTFTVKAFYIDLQGDDFDVEEEVFLGNDWKSGYTTIAGTFKASKSVCHFQEPGGQVRRRRVHDGWRR